MPRHCWLRLRRHRWRWHRGLHGLFEYAMCDRCGWPPLVAWGMRKYTGPGNGWD